MAATKKRNKQTSSPAEQLGEQLVGYSRKIFSDAIATVVDVDFDSLSRTEIVALATRLETAMQAARVLIEGQMEEPDADVPETDPVSPATTEDLESVVCCPEGVIVDPQTGIVNYELAVQYARPIFPPGGGWVSPTNVNFILGIAGSKWHIRSNILNHVVRQLGLVNNGGTTRASRYRMPQEINSTNNAEDEAHPDFLVLPG